MVTFTQDSTNWWILRGKIDPRVVEYLRRTVPQRYRYFDGDTSAWMIHTKYVDATRQLLNSCNKSSEDDPYAVLHLRPTAPPAIIKAVWRELAKTLHPDRGGDVEQFKRVKAAYDRLITKV